MNWFGRHSRLLSSCMRRMATSMSSLPIRLRSIPRFVKAGASGVVIFALGWGQNLPAQQFAAPGAAPGFVTLDNFSGSMALSNDGGSYLLFDKMIGDGPGVDDGYSRIGLRTNLFDTPNGHFFGEVHGLITDNSRLGVNVGGGYRWFDGDAVWGLNSWYDDYESRTGNRYQQIGFGAEYLSQPFDARINGYAPIGKRDNYVGLVNPGTELTYFGNSLGTIGTGAFEASQAGFDLEGGVPFPFSDWARFYSGLYYMSGRGIDTTGVRARAEARFTEGVTLNFIAQNDNTFGTNLNLNVTVQFNGEMPTRFGAPYSTLTRRYDQVRRTWAVQTTNFTDSVNVPLVNPDTNENYNLYWVNNTNTRPGNGTFENPGQQLPDFARNADLILVQRGVGNTLGNINLLNGQELLGEGKAHFVNTDRLGVIQLPTTNFSDTGALPTLAALDPAQPIITLADDNRVVGLNFAGGNAIAGQDVNNFYLECLTGNVQNGVNIVGASGLGVIRDVDFTVGAGGTGIRINNDSRTPLSLDIDRLATRSGAVGLEIDAIRSPVTASIDRFSSTGSSQAGLVLLGDRTEMNVAVTRSNMLDGAGHGAQISLRGATGTTSFTDSILSRNALDGLHAVADKASDYNIDVIDSFLRQNGDDNIDTDAIGASRLDVFVDPTVVSFGGDNNFEFLVDGDSTFSGTFLDSDLTRAGRDGINGTVNGNSVVTLNLQRSSASGAGQDGFDVSVMNGSSLFTNVTDGSFAGAGQNGLSQTVQNGSVSSLIVNGTNVNGAGNTGLLFNVDGGGLGASQLNIAANNTTFNSSGVNNIRGTVSRGSSTSLNFNNVNATGGATNGGVDLLVQTGGVLNSNWNGGTISNTGADGLDLQVNGGQGSRANMTFSGVTVNGNAGDGINANLTNGRPNSQMNISLTNSTLSTNQGSGLDYSIAGSGTFPVGAARPSGVVTFDNSLLTLNGEDGFQFDVSGGAQLSGSALSTFNALTSNGSNAVQGTVTGSGSIADLTIGGLQASGSGGSGLELTAQNSGVLNFNVNQGTISSNGIHGMDLHAETGGTLNAGLTNVIVNNNRRNGIQFVAETQGLLNLEALGGSVSNNGTQAASSGVRGFTLGAGSQASVHFDGTVADNNSQHGYSFRAESGSTMIADLRTSGANGTLSASDNTGNGVNFTALGANTRAALVMEGNNQFNRNGGDGVFVRGSSIEQLAVAISGTIEDNVGDGVDVVYSGVNNGAFTLNGADGSISGNGGDAVRLGFNGTSLNDITVTTLARTTTVNGFSIDGVTIDGADVGGDGIHIDFNGTTIAEGQGGITNTRITNAGDDGLHLNFVNSTANGFLISGNGFESNVANGLRLDAANSNLDRIQIVDNNLGGVSAAQATFLMSGDPFIDPFLLTNSSQTGINITGFNLNIAPSGNFFDTSFGQTFQPAGLSDLATGLTTVNGTAITAGTNPLEDSLGNVLVDGGVADGSTLLNLAFNDFNSGEALSWNLDVDPTGSGAGLAGSTVNITFSDGSSASGAMTTVAGNPNVGIFTTNTGTVVGGTRQNGADGIQINLDNSSMLDAEISRNVSEANAGNGLSIVARNTSTVSGTIADNSISGNGLAGVNLDFDNSSLDGTTLSGNTIQNNAGDGVLFAFNNATLSNLTIADNPEISNNQGNGVNFQMVNSTINGMVLDNNGLGVVAPPPPVSQFDIQVVFGGGLTPSQQAIFAQAEARWESIIIGDVVDFAGIDDLVINAAGVAIDGNGGILGQAGPTGLRPATFLPFSGIMQFDSADLAALEASGQLEDVILHEMGHVLGFGTIWDNLGLITGSGTADPVFTGALATAEYNARFGQAGTSVPVENTGGPGTANAHWRETIFDNELMTGFLNAGVVNPISRTTIAQWADLGYTVDMAQADPYLVAPVVAPGPVVSVEEGEVSRPTEVVASTANLSSLAGSMPELVLGGDGLLQLAALRVNQLNGVNISLTNSDLTGGVISNNIISGNVSGNGIRLVNPTTQTGAAIELDINRNTISNNGSHGVEIALNGTEQLVSNIAGNTISNNTGMGISVTGRDNSVITTNYGGTAAPADPLDTNTLNANVEAGIGYDLADNASAAIVLRNTGITNTSDNGTDTRFGGDGLAVRTANSAHVTSLSVDGSAFASNNGSGMFVNALNQSRVDDLTVDNSSFSDNAFQGIDIRRTSSADFSQGARGSIQIQNSLFGDSSQLLGDAGIQLTFAGTNTPQAIDFNNNTFTGNNAGVRIDGSQAARLTGSINDNTFANILGNGVSATLIDNSALGDPTAPATPFEMLGNQFTTITGNAIDVTTAGNAYANVITGESATRRMVVAGANRAFSVDDNATTPAAAQFSISGADITNTNQSAVFVRMASGDRTVNVNDVNITNPTTGAPSTGSGVQIIANNNSLTSNITDLTVVGGNGSGLVVANNTAAGMNLTGANISATDTGVGGIIINDTSTGNSTINLTTVDVTGSGDINSNSDGISIQKTTGGNLTANLLDVSSTFNSGRGLFVSARNDDGGRNVFNIGSIGGAQSEFSDNGGSGVQFVSQASALDQTLSAANADVLVDDVTIDQVAGQYVDTNSRDRVVSTFNLLNALVQGNGNDGVFLQVGSSTLVNSQLAGLTMGGNSGFDINITPIVSISTALPIGPLNPPDSIDNAPGTADVLAFDPVAHLDLVLGSADTTGDGLAENNASTFNTGTQINVAFAGVAPTGAVPQGGLFTNNDVFKGTNRAVQLAGQVQMAGLLNTPSNNFNNAVQQDIEALFTGQPFFNIVPQTLFPDNNP